MKLFKKSLKFFVAIIGLTILLLLVLGCIVYSYVLIMTLIDPEFDLLNRCSEPVATCHLR